MHEQLPPEHEPCDEQVMAEPTHDPLLQTSLVVQLLPSLHPVPLPAFGLLQTPVLVLHVPTAWHWSDALQVTVLALVQAPF